ncbi:DNA-binding protein [Bacteroidetes/Chlorobi group bacterium ChocPot_Mid]|nr:MAG: DNA-binding protein [Bacteroidetes/Chlorobi group bacterium ChocPot_Mid]
MFKNKMVLIALLSIALFYACGKDERPVPEGYTRGVVIETMNSGGYTYMLLNQDGDEVWIAANQIEVKKDDTVYYSKAMEMKDFHSNTMNRDFKKIIFADDCTKNPWGNEKTQNQNPKGMPPMGKGNPHENMSNEKQTDLKIEPIKNGFTIEQIYKQKNSLAGKPVRVKGKVVKFNSQILGKNWVHIQDGTGSAQDFDLPVTTMETFNVGDVVTFEGVLAIDKDFGSGYKFSVIIENAIVVREPAGI